MDSEDSSIPVITLDDDDIKQSERLGEEDLGGLSSPKDFLIPAALNGAKIFSPGLESTTLEESAFEESTLKNPHQGCLESTRLSNHCAPGEFDPENDLSKGQEAGDSRNPLNAGFVHDNSNSFLPDAMKTVSMESSSVLVESDSEAGILSLACTSFVFPIMLKSFASGQAQELSNQIPLVLKQGMFIIDSFIIFHS